MCAALRSEHRFHRLEADSFGVASAKEKLFMQELAQAAATKGELWLGIALSLTLTLSQTLTKRYST